MLDCVEPSLAAEGGGGQVRLEHCFHTSAVLPACGVLAGAAGYSVMVQQVEGGVIAAVCQRRFGVILRWSGVAPAGAGGLAWLVVNCPKIGIKLA